MKEEGGNAGRDVTVSLDILQMSIWSLWDADRQQSVIL